MVYMNTNVTRGAGEFVVTSTGMATEVGHISGMLQHQDESKSPLTVQLEKLTKQLVTIAGLALVASVVLNMARGQSFTEVFTVAVAFSIAAIPTGLPAVVTTILSRGTRLLAEANAIVKRLRSTETLGATSAICSDKTGTLTLNQMTAVELTIPGRRYKVSGSGYSTEGQIKHVGRRARGAAGAVHVPARAGLRRRAHRRGRDDRRPDRGRAVVLAEKGGLDLELTRERYPRVAELPFDTAYKLMATFHRMTDESRGRGHPLLRQGRARPAARARDVARRPAMAAAPVDDAFRDALPGRERAAGQAGPARDGHGAARLRPGALRPGRATCSTLMDGLTLLALVGIVDPPRPAAKAAIATAHDAGIQVRMITGDHADHRRGDRPRAGHRGPRDLRRASSPSSSDDAGRRRDRRASA